MKIKIQVGDFKVETEERNAINKVLDAGRISEGEQVKEFEKNFASYVGTKYSIAVSSGTSALIVGITALKYHTKFKIKPESKIITTPLTYIATSNAVVVSGFEPVYVDVDEKTFVITPENIKAHLEEADDPDNYSLILPVHLMGYPCDMDEINKIAKRYGLLTIEDSAQAHGTVYKGKKTGSLSLLSDFSFYIAHNIQAGEMGAVTTDNLEIIKLIRKLKANGRVCDCFVCTRAEGKCPKLTANQRRDFDYDPRFTHDLIGYNFKTMEFTAALANTQLKKADWITRRRRENVEYLNEHLERFSDVIQLPEFMDSVSYLAYPIVIKPKAPISRSRLRAELEKQGIETRPLFGCIPTQQPAYAYLKEKYADKLPNASFLGKNGFYIGCHQYLQEDELEYIVKVMGDIL
jgi:dTDP-4-amino-4,6-dideoxygalactose transaminase